MQESQLEVDHLAISMMRTPSRHTRDNKKVSCETLSNVDWYSRRPYEAQLFYHSDGSESEKPASEAELDGDGDEVDDIYVEGKGHTEKLEHHGLGEGLSAQAQHFLACFHSKTARDLSAPIAAASSPGRDAKKVERVPRSYPSPIPHSGSLVPPSGTKILPHSGPIKLHVGSHANTHTSTKASGSLRGSLLVPLNIEGKSSKSSGFGSANEPCSPKVTCLGRVKIKQKYCREMGRLADMAAVAAPAEKLHKSIGDRMMKLKQRMKKAQEDEDKALSRGEIPKGAAVDVSVRSKDVRKADKAAMLSSAGAQKDHHKVPGGGSWASHAEKTLIDDTASDSADSKKRGKWKLKESGARMKLLSSEKKKSCQAWNAEGFQSDMHGTGLDLNRFHSCSGRSNMQENRLSHSMMSMAIEDEPQETGHGDQRQFEPQVPPPNSLLLMRNSRNRGTCATVAASSSCGKPCKGWMELCESSGSVNRQVFVSKSEGESLKQALSASHGVHMDEEEQARVHMDEGEQAHSLQSSSPSTPLKAASLWERRNALKPAALEV